MGNLIQKSKHIGGDPIETEALPFSLMDQPVTKRLAVNEAQGCQGPNAVGHVLGYKTAQAFNSQPTGGDP